MGSGKKRRLSRGSDEEGEEPRSKKSRESLWKVPPILDKQTDLCLTMFTALRKCKDSENKNMSDFLMRAPSRRLWPSYYDIITQPIDLMKIQQKVKTEEYKLVSSFFADMQLLFDNSFSFYSPSSEEYHQVTDLQSAFTLIAIEYGFGFSTEPRSDSDSVVSPSHLTLRISKSHFQPPPRESSPHIQPPLRESSPMSAIDIKTSLMAARLSKLSSSKAAASAAVAGGRGKASQRQGWVQDYAGSGDPVKICIGSVYEHRDILTGDSLSEPFHSLPSRSEYPEYYRVITQPIDLKTICKNAEAGKYPNLKSVQEDMILMIKNAHHFNEPSSDIYKKASSLRKIILLRCSELEKKYKTVTKSLPLKVTPKRPPDSGSLGNESEGKKVPKIKIASLRGLKSSISSSSDFEDQQMDSSEYELTSDDEEEGTREDPPPSHQGKLLLRIKKEQLGKGSSQTQQDPVAKLLQAKKPPILKKKLMCVYKKLVKKADPQGRILSELFMRRPSSKLYPEYYLVIKEPIDLREILKKIKSVEYASLKELESAVELMVQNALTFNEEDSQIYSDALVLREVAQATIKQIRRVWPDTPSSSPTPGPSNTSATPTFTTPSFPAPRGRPRKVLTGQVTTPYAASIPADVLALFNAVKNHTVNRRYVWVTFKKLPSGVSSEYYSVVKKPIDMTIIQSKMNSGDLYQSLEQLMDDFTLMLDNAFTFFPPQSPQAMDAITLQRVIFKKYASLRASNPRKYESPTPNVKGSVNKILSDILTRTLASEEECVSVLRSLEATREAEFQDEGVVRHTYKLDNVEKWLAEDGYQRLDEFQADVLAIVLQATKEKGRGVADDLARKFLSIRDELCGEEPGKLWSPALSYSAV